MSIDSFRLLVVQGPDAGREFVGQPAQPLRIGRGQDTETRLADPSVSRLHAELRVNGPVLELVHLSTSGVSLVNGQPVGAAPVALQVGDLIQLADTILRLEVVARGDDTTRPPALANAAPLANSPLARELIGTRLHHYRIGSLLSEGPAGIVFRAEDEQQGLRPVALKVIWPQAIRDEASRKRFVRAMTVMYPIRHPNLIRICNAGYTAEFCWVAMEYVDGENLRKVMARLGAAGMLDWTKAFRIGRDIARGLTAAAEHQVLHRNILPENILLRRADGVAQLGDLELAKALEQSGEGADGITRPGELVGDVAYMSPERTLASPQIDCRSDIYSLGVTLYVLVTGRLPFVSTNLVELIRQIRTQPAKPIRTFQLSVNDLFAGLVEQMLSKKPEDRPQTPEALLRELDRIGKMTGQPI